MTTEIRTAGGAGPVAATQTPLMQLRRATLACMLWENVAYESGTSGAANVASLVAQCDPEDVAKLALEIRTKQGLRKVPLFLLRELVRRPEARKIVGEYLPQVIQRADEPAEFLSMYWKDEPGAAIANQVKKGLAASLEKFQAYHFGKYKGLGDAVSLRDVLHLVHGNPGARTEAFRKGDRKGWTEEQAKAKLTDREFLYWQISNNCLPVPVTRETMLSAAKTDAAKRAGFESMIVEKQLGALATLRNLALMKKVGVSNDLIRQALSQARPDRLLPLNFLAAVKAAPEFTAGITTLMKECMKRFDRLPGHTVFVIDTSESMGALVSEGSEFSRRDAACALAVMAQEVCEKVDIYLTASGDDGKCMEHATAKVEGPLTLGINLRTLSYQLHLSGGGIFTFRCVEYLRKQYPATGPVPDRLVVFSDSADCGIKDPQARPFCKYNYIADVSSHAHGVNYAGRWTAEISGWSQSLIDYIASYEAGFQFKLF